MENRDALRQPGERMDVCASGDKRIIGTMIESNLVAGFQPLIPGQPLTYGQSITDACIDWTEIHTLLAELAAAVRARRR